MNHFVVVLDDKIMKTNVFNKSDELDKLHIEAKALI